MVGRVVPAATLLILLWAVAIGSATEPSKETSTELKSAQAIKTLLEAISMLNGRADHLEDRMAIMADEFKNRPEMLQIAGPLAKLIKQGSSENQKEKFIEQLIGIACQNFQDNCELRRRMMDLEHRLGELERQRQHEPTPAEPYKPVQPRLPPTLAPIAPVPPSQPRTPFMPGPQWWNGVPAKIVDRFAYLDQPAQVIYTNVKRRFGAEVYYGDVYRDRFGRVVFLHQTEQVPQNLAYPGSR